MKKLTVVFTLFLLTITSACSDITTEDIHSKIHGKFSNIGSYSADCTVTTFYGNSRNSYECNIKYNQKENSYILTSEDMTIHINDEKATIKKGDSSFETPTSNEDMQIFINTFFESYYECEDTVTKTAVKGKSGQTLLECSVLNPTEYSSYMKLWIDNKSILPKKMQIISKDGNTTTEIIFKKFEFTEK